MFIYGGSCLYFFFNNNIAFACSVKRVSAKKLMKSADLF